MTTEPGEIYLADIFEGGVRPVIVVTRPELNRGTLSLVVPVTSSRVTERRRYANYVFLPARTGGLRADSVAATHLVQPVRNNALADRWGRIPPSVLAEIRVAIAWSIALVP